MCCLQARCPRLVPLAVSGVALLALGGCGPHQAFRPVVESPAPRAASGAALVFDGVTVIDVEDGARLADQRVVIGGRWIQAMGQRAAVPLPAGAQVVDARGQYLIPGLWDWHTHPVMLPDIYFPAFVANGVTGIRNAGTVSLDSAMQWRREILAGRRVGPPRQILSSQTLWGQGACYAGWPCVTGPRRARHLVDSFHAAGADMLKMYRLGSKRLYGAVAAAARRVGMPFGGHIAAGTLTALEASDLGASIIDHPSDLDRGDVAARCLLPTATLTTCRELVERFRRNGTWWVPTLSVIAQVNNLYHFPFQPVTDTLLAHYQAFVKAFQAKGSVFPRYSLDSVSVAALRARPADSLGLLRFVERLNWPILAGTDAVLVGLFVSSWPGFSLHTELAVYVAEGMTPLAALQTATLNPAKYLRATDSLGTVAVGKLADLVLLEADPLAEITNTQRIRAVVANGRYFDRAALDALLRDARRAHRSFRADTSWEQATAPFMARRAVPLQP